MMALSLVLLLSACGAKLDGVYANGAWKLSFQPNGKVSTVILGNRMETSYSVASDKVEFQFPGGDHMALTMNKDGSLVGIIGKFVKQ